MSKSGKVESTNVPTTNLDKIQLKDGTVLNLPLNGSEYESPSKITASIFSEDNLSAVSINDEPMGMMVLHSMYDFGEGTRFTLRKPTELEEKLIQQEKTNTDLQLALAQVFEMMIATTGGV